MNKRMRHQHSSDEQLKLKFHLVNHYKKLASAKKTIDTNLNPSPGLARKRQSAAQLKTSRFYSSTDFCSLESGLQSATVDAQHQKLKYWLSSSIKGSRFSSSLEDCRPVGEQIGLFLDKVNRVQRNEVDGTQRVQRQRLYGSHGNLKSPSTTKQIQWQRQPPTPVFSRASSKSVKPAPSDLLESHKHCFREQSAPYMPRTLVTSPMPSTAVSRLKGMRCYNPPRRPTESPLQTQRKDTNHEKDHPPTSNSDTASDNSEGSSSENEWDAHENSTEQKSTPSVQKPSDANSANPNSKPNSRATSAGNPTANQNGKTSSLDSAYEGGVSSAESIGVPSRGNTPEGAAVNKLGVVMKGTSQHGDKNVSDDKRKPNSDSAKFDHKWRYDDVDVKQLNDLMKLAVDRGLTSDYSLQLFLEQQLSSHSSNEVQVESLTSRFRDSLGISKVNQQREYEFPIRVDDFLDKYKYPGLGGGDCDNSTAKPRSSNKTKQLHFENIKMSENQRSRVKDVLYLGQTQAKSDNPLKSSVKSTHPLYNTDNRNAKTGLPEREVSKNVHSANQRSEIPNLPTNRRVISEHRGQGDSVIEGTPQQHSRKGLANLDIYDAVQGLSVEEADLLWKAGIDVRLMYNDKRAVAEIRRDVVNLYLG